MVEFQTLGKYFSDLKLVSDNTFVHLHPRCTTVWTLLPPPSPFTLQEKWRVLDQGQIDWWIWWMGIRRVSC